MSQGTDGGGGESRPLQHDDQSSLVRHAEQASVGTYSERVASARARRRVEHETVRADYPREREEVQLERVSIGDDDSGKIETLPDGSISIPLFEEELVVTKRIVLRERVIIRKESVTDLETVEAQLRREHIEFDADAPAGSGEPG